MTATLVAHLPADQRAAAYGHPGFRLIVLPDDERIGQTDQRRRPSEAPRSPLDQPGTYRIVVTR